MSNEDCGADDVEENNSSRFHAYLFQCAVGEILHVRRIKSVECWIARPSCLLTHSNQGFPPVKDIKSIIYARPLSMQCSLGPQLEILCGGESLLDVLHRNDGHGTVRR